jgi:hypothetical protein
VGVAYLDRIEERDMGDPVDGGDSLVGVFMVELPPDWWLPEGYSLKPNGPQVPLSVTDPFGRDRQIYATAGFRPSQERVDSIAEVIERELGPLQLGLSPETRHQLGTDRPDLLGAVNRTIMMPVEAAVALLDLASYGIRATIVAGTQGMAQAGWMSQTDAARLRRDLNLMAIVAAAETGRPTRLMTTSQEAAARVATMARAQAIVAAAPVMLVRVARTAGEQFGRGFMIVGDMATAGGPQFLPVRIRFEERLRLIRGRRFNAAQRVRYQYNELYVRKATGKGYWILDSYEPAQGPVSRKFTQLAKVELDSALKVLSEAYDKYKPGTVIGSVRTTPPALRGQQITGQLVLEVPIQTLAIPPEILARARQLNIQIRDVTGRIY